MANLKVPTTSTQYIKVPVSVIRDGGAYDPTGDTVQMAFTTSGDTDPQDSDYLSALWETVGTTYYAKALIGPGINHTLAPNTYFIWVKITDNPEVPVILAPNHLVIF